MEISGEAPTERLIPPSNPVYDVLLIGDILEGGLPIFVMDRVFSAASRSAALHQDRVTLGWFLGGYHSWQGYEYIFVEHSVPARGGEDRPGAFAITNAVWENLDEDRRRIDPASRLIGWWIGMPGQGLYVSDVNFDMHRRYFSSAWQVHLVIDPTMGDAAWFRWEGDVLASTGFLQVSLKDRPRGD